MILLPVQCRMARAALGLGVRELAAAAKVSIDTVARFERGAQLKERTVEALQRVLEASGVEFANGAQPGVRLSSSAYTHLSGSTGTVGNKTVRGKPAKATEKKR